MTSHPPPKTNHRVGDTPGDAGSREYFLPRAVANTITLQRAGAPDRDGLQHASVGQRVHQVQTPTVAAAGPGTERPRQHAWPIARGIGQPDVERPIGAAESLQEVRVTILREREFGGAVIRFRDLSERLGVLRGVDSETGGESSDDARRAVRSIANTPFVDQPAETLAIPAATDIRLRGQTPEELLQSDQWAWQDLPSAWGDSQFMQTGATSQSAVRWS